MPQSFIGTAGWSIPGMWNAHFPDTGSHLERYAARFRGVEINSSFYKQHRRATYEKWAASVPDDFRFSVKLPRAITHDQSLIACDVLLEVFLEDVLGLGGKLGPLIVQLPPSAAFNRDGATEFFDMLRERVGGAVVCEARNSTWFSGEAETVLVNYRIARVLADPACVPAAAQFGGWSGMHYARLHGSPVMYRSAYADEYLRTFATLLSNGSECERWCMFDNTASGAATGDALRLREILAR